MVNKACQTENSSSESSINVFNNIVDDPSYKPETDMVSEDEEDEISDEYDDESLASASHQKLFIHIKNIARNSSFVFT